MTRGEPAPPFLYSMVGAYLLLLALILLFKVIVEKRTHSPILLLGLITFSLYKLSNRLLEQESMFLSGLVMFVDTAFI